MALTFADTYNMIAYLTKSDASEGFDQILDFLNVNAIQYALTVNPNIYVSYIKQFWTSVLIKKVNDVVRLEALIDRKKVIIIEDTVREALHLDDVENIDCLPNEEIFAELARMGTAWNEFSSSMASAIVLQVLYVSKIPTTDDTVGMGFSGVETPLFEGMLVLQQAADVVVDVVVDDVAADDVPAADAEPTAPTTIQPPPQQEKRNKVKAFGLKRLKKVGTAQRIKSSAYTVMDDQEDASKQEGKIAKIDADEDVILEDVAAELEKDAKVAKDADVQGRQEESQAQVYHIDLEHANKVLSMQDDEPEPDELKEVIEVVTTAKLMTEAVTVASTITAAPSVARRRKGVVIRDTKETATPSTIIEQDEAYARELEAELKKNINWDDVIEQVKEKGKQDNAVLRYQSLKRKPQTEAQARKNMMVYLKNMEGFKMDFFRGMSYEDIRPIFEKYFNSNVAFLEKSKEQLEEEESRALKRKTESSEEKAAKKQKLDEEIEELKKHLKIVPNDDDDVYTKATPLALKIVQERFASSKPKNFSDDILLTTLKAMFKKPDVEAQVWKNQRERRYPLTRFTLDKMLNNVRLEVKEESEVSLELLRFVKRQQQEGYRPE
nr:hypothetical protein [Tanacetum cinerariifolium]